MSLMDWQRIKVKRIKNCDKHLKTGEKELKKKKKDKKNTYWKEKWRIGRRD